MSEILSLIIIGLLAGALSGLLGMGGGIAIVPGLIIMNLVNSQQQAQAISLGVLLLPVALPAFISYYEKEKQYISLKFIGITIFGNILGSVFGAYIANKLPSFWLTKIYGIFLLLQGIKMILPKKVIVNPENDSQTDKDSKKLKQIYKFLIVGLLTGILSGTVGIGGALILIPMLLHLGYNQHQAQGFSLGIFSLPLGPLTSFMIYRHNQNFSNLEYIPYIAYIAGAFLLSSFLFSRIAIKIPTQRLKLYFTVLVLINAIYFIFIRNK